MSRETSHPGAVPTYGYAEAARYLRLPPSTLRSWFAGRSPVIEPATPRLLSFWNLVEAYVLAQIRRAHKVSLQRVRVALRWVEDDRGLEHPLIDETFYTDGYSLFVQKLTRGVGSVLVNTTAGGQTVLPALVAQSVKRVEWDHEGLAARLFPWANNPNEERAVEINPSRGFGKLVVANTGVPTAAIAERFAAGESARHLAHDYRLSVAQVNSALRWERVLSGAAH